MVANALLLSLTLLLALAFYLMGELKFLIPYRAFLYHEYGWALATFVGVGRYFRKSMSEGERLLRTTTTTEISTYLL